MLLCCVGDFYFMRELIIKQNDYKEFNRLLIINIDTFLIDYCNNIDYYKPPFEILSELEKLILFENDPDETILISYKNGGDIIFNKERIYTSGPLRIVEYKFSGTIS